MVYDVTDFANNLILLSEIDKLESNLSVEDNKLKIKLDDYIMTLYLTIKN